MTEIYCLARLLKNTKNPYSSSKQNKNNPYRNNPTFPLKESPSYRL